MTMTEALTPVYCATHPNVETTLRCNRCEKPICPKCAVLVPTGYRCKDCVRGQQKVYETAQWVDYPLVMGVVALLAFGGSLIAYRLGFFTIILSPIAGAIIAEAARFVSRQRRSRNLFLLAVVAAVAGCLPMLVVFLIYFDLFPIIWHAVYAVLLTSSLYYRMSGIKIG